MNVVGRARIPGVQCVRWNPRDVVSAAHRYPGYQENCRSRMVKKSWQSWAFNGHSESGLQMNSTEGIGGPPIPVQHDRNMVDNKLFGSMGWKTENYAAFVM